MPATHSQSSHSPAGQRSLIAPAEADWLRILAELGNAPAGVLDEARGGAGGSGNNPLWRRFFESLGPQGMGDLPRRAHALARQLRDNGVTYNVYADTVNGAQRPWALDLLPVLLSAQDWRGIAAGVLQRTRLLNHIMADVYGPQKLLLDGSLPPALVYGHPSYLRGMRGVQAPTAQWLPIVAFDLAHGPDGNWWVVSQRTQAPSGLGYALENRMAVGRQFTGAFGDLNVQRLAATYHALLQGLKSQLPQGDAAKIVLLTPGPYNETYFEHAYLARYLGLPLVEGGDLVVRNEHLYLRTLKGLEPVAGVLKRLDDEFLDPLELRADSRLGVPGLMQCIRAGNVVVANAPGSGFLESPALLGFMPALAERLLGAPLSLPALPTWWCGEAAALRDVAPRLRETVIKPTNANTAPSVIGKHLSASELTAWQERVAHCPEQFTAQQWLALSHTPTWQGLGASAAGLSRRAMMLRVFVVCQPSLDGQPQWQVMPGGLARLAQAGLGITSMQHGGSSADVWVLTDGDVDQTPHVAGTNWTQPIDKSVPSAALGASTAKPMGTATTDGITSRAAESLFWFGRYTERCEHSVRLARIALECNAEDRPSEALSTWLVQLCSSLGLVEWGTPEPGRSPRVFERSVVAGLPDAPGACGVGYSLAALHRSASTVRERLSREHWRLIDETHSQFVAQCLQSQSDGDFSSAEGVRLLGSLSAQLAGITGAQSDRMSRDDGWRLLTIGRQVERLAQLAASLAQGIETRSFACEAGFDALLELFDSTITFRARYQMQRSLPALLELLVLDRDNPRSLAWVAQQMRGRLLRLADAGRSANLFAEPANTWVQGVTRLADRVPDVDQWMATVLAQLKDPDAQSEALTALAATLRQLQAQAGSIADGVSTQYFNHEALTPGLLR